MKLIFLTLYGLISVVFASPFPKVEQQQTPVECYRGQLYWCQDLKSAKSCNAVTHCIQSVWEKQIYPIDTDSICKICLDMVTQARDQLRSNETQADLKAVFEGTCHLIPLKPVEKECDKLADDFVPELVEALSSQMNPQVVCSVAGLCNNAAIDEMLAKLPKEGDVSQKGGLSCPQCNKVSSLITNKFRSTNRDDILENMLTYCGQWSSLSDGCSNIVLTYFNEIYDHLSTNLNADNICHMSGVCAAQYHQHEEEEIIEIVPESQIGFVKPGGDDIPCDLCKQLVGHLRDLLVANTTEAEFKTVLEGICKQTKSFKSECLSIADQYYDVIYNKLTTNLDPNGACFLIGICPKGLGEQKVSGQIMPLLPVQTVNNNRKVLGADEPKLSAQEIQSAQLPIDMLLINPVAVSTQLQSGNGQICTLCEYFLHFVQEALASPKNEESIKEVVLKTCSRLPNTVRGECQSFVDTYGDAIIALLIQDIDPSQVCPKLTLCATQTRNEKCPLCLFLVQEAEELLKSNKSKENIKHTLSTLCNHLSKDLKAECADFVQTYAAELIDKLSDDFTPEQICVYLKLCTQQDESYVYNMGVNNVEVDIMTNSIEDNTVNGIEISQYNIENSSPECVLCEHFIKEVEKRATNNKSEEHIKQVLEEACATFHKEKLKQKCIQLIDKNSDYIIKAIVKDVSPKEICVVLGFCVLSGNKDSVVVDVRKEGPDCILCELVMTKLEKELHNNKTKEEIAQAIQHICVKFPSSIKNDCQKFVFTYAETVVMLLSTLSPKEICTQIKLCTPSANQPDTNKLEVLECAICHGTTNALEKFIDSEEIKDRDMIVDKTCNHLPGKYHRKCTEFLDIYIESLINLIRRSEKSSEICVKIGMCFANEYSGFVDMTDSEPEIKTTQPTIPSTTKPATNLPLLGAKKCTYGPSYWCSSKEKMDECNAHEFCLNLKRKQMQVISP